MYTKYEKLFFTSIFMSEHLLHVFYTLPFVKENRFISELRRGDLYTDKYQIEGAISTEPFTDRFEHLVAGWAVTFDITTFNDISVCN